MELSSVLGLLGGLALFLYGMQMMTNGLESAAGDRLRNILEFLTTNRFIGVVVGALVTALVQSSSATTVMIVGFVNAGIMQLHNAVWMIMGANIGTTITGQIVALDIVAFAPVLAFVGVSMIFFIKKKRINAYGTILAGLGVLFIGMNMMSEAMVPFRSNPAFVSLLAKFENPLLGLLVGAIFTAVIQSSSASVGILQAMALGGVISLPQAIYILFGQNIGTCITAILGSAGMSVNAKRTSTIHVIFNTIGAVLFTVIAMTTPFTDWLIAFTPDNAAAQIANVHTIFNVVTTLVLLPFGYKMVDLSIRLIKDKPDPKEEPVVQFLDFALLKQDYHFGSNALAITQLFKEVQHMLALVKDNMQVSFELMLDYDSDKFFALEEREDKINKLNEAIVSFTSRALASELPQSGIHAIGLFLKTSTDLERIGDHAKNIAEHARDLNNENRSFSNHVAPELTEMNVITHKTLELLQIRDLDHFSHILNKIKILEEQIDGMYAQYELNQIERLRSNRCSIENSIQYSKILSDFERVGDHCLNIARNYNDMKRTINTLRTAEAIQDDNE